MAREEEFKGELMLNQFGGGPPPGWGAHPGEQDYWKQPRFRKHPLTGKMEAIGGIFHRLWPEHVDVLRQMREDGWPHKDIIDVAQEFWVRQEEDYENKQQMVLQLKQQKMQNMQQDLMEAFTGISQQPMGGMPGMPPGPPMPPMPPLGPPPTMKSLRTDLTMLSGSAYEKALSEYKKRYCSPLKMAYGIRGLKKGIVKSSLAFPALGFEFDALEPTFDTDTMKSHYNTHFRGYYDKLKKDIKDTSWKHRSIEEILYNLDSLPEDKKESIRFNGGGFANHILWFHIIKPFKRNSKVSIPLMRQINSSFGTIQKMKELLFDVARGLRGSGWVWLVVDKDGDLLVTKTENQDSPMMIGDTPIIGLDMWEHAYYKKFGPDKESYMNAFWKLINWDNVSLLYKDAMKSKISKADVPGEPLLSPKQSRVKYDQTFTRKPTGISNAPHTGVAEKDSENPLNESKTVDVDLDEDEE